MALSEVNQAREDRKDAKNAPDDDLDDSKAVLEGSSIPVEVSAELTAKLKAKQRTYLGTSKVIKLPYIIGTDEYK